MLNLSQTTGYAIQALSCLSDPANPPRKVEEIARRTRIPRPYLAKIINALAREGLILSRRGRLGGVALARRPEDITLLQIVEAVEGTNWLGRCLLGFSDCSNSHSCPTHDFWVRTRAGIVEELARTPLHTVINFQAPPGAAGMPPAPPPCCGGKGPCGA